MKYSLPRSNRGRLFFLFDSIKFYLAIKKKDTSILTQLFKMEISMKQKKLFQVLIPACCFLLSFISIHASDMVTGVVFNDINRNLTRDPGEDGISGIMVSNQRDVVKTDSAGLYKIPINDETVIFVTKPPGYDLPVDDNNLPQFYYIHHPRGSPDQKFKGVAPTGPLPESVDFPLFKTSVRNEFDVIVMGDPQPLNKKQIDFMTEDIIAKMSGSDALFAIALGDIMFDNLSLYDYYNKIMGTIGVPIFNVPGNHDLNQDSKDDVYSMETFKSKFGPAYYSFEYGQVHFIIFDDVEWYMTEKDGKKRGRYRGKFGETQLNWLKNDLEFVSKDKLIVLNMHIALYTLISGRDSDNVIDREKLFEILKGREKILALTGHNHTGEHHFLDKKHGWMGNEPIHELICTTLCGSWWGGPPDEREIPCATQQDGSPNGYYIFHFEGNNYSERFSPAFLPESFQIRIEKPEIKFYMEEARELQVIANVFDGSIRSTVDVQINNQAPVKMKKTDTISPFFQKLHKKNSEKFRSWVKPIISNHIWTATLVSGLKPGFHTITVNTVDQFGQKYSEKKIFEIIEEKPQGN
jgi:calcineurin-like phosphoesterase family protein